MTKDRLISLAKEITDLLNMSPDELDAMRSEIDGNNKLSLATTNDELTAWVICYTLAENRRATGRLHECLQKYGIGLGGEDIIDLAIEEIHKLRGSREC